MKIRDARQAYSAQLDALRDKRRALSQLLEKQENGDSPVSSFDRLELTRELSQVNAQYEATHGVMEGIVARQNAILDSEAAKQQSEALAEAAEEIAKMMEVFRRISSGAKVPPADEKKLMDFNHELYMAAKSAAMMAQNDEEYDSLWEDEEEDSDQAQDPFEIADNSEIAVPAPEAVAAEAVAEMP